MYVCFCFCVLGIWLGLSFFICIHAYSKNTLMFQYFPTSNRYPYTLIDYGCNCALWRDSEWEADGTGQ
jgi:hypothetical protein